MAPYTLKNLVWLFERLGETNVITYGDGNSLNMIVLL